ncbi:MAG TPA: hypothetical protein VMB84_16990 [Stellaceae bacterium]|nr:hypothetical protein [Stellaceae bacterium]
MDQDLRRRTLVFGAALGAALAAASGGPARGQNAAASLNPYNDELVRDNPTEQAAKLAGYVGPSCIGTHPFMMGMTKQGAAKGYAYWSVQCAGGRAYMIQLTPDGEAASVDCEEVKLNGHGRECYKTF